MNKITKTMLVLLMLGVAIAAGCGDKDAEPTLVGSWRLEGYQVLEGVFETPVCYMDSNYTVTFRANGTIFGFASSNQSYGTFFLSADGAIEIKFQTMTEAGECDEGKFIDAINNTNSYAFQKGNLMLYYNLGQNFMRFKPWRQ